MSAPHSVKTWRYLPVMAAIARACFRLLYIILVVRLTIYNKTEYSVIMDKQFEEENPAVWLNNSSGGTTTTEQRQVTKEPLSQLSKLSYSRRQLIHLRQQKPKVKLSQEVIKALKENNIYKARGRKAGRKRSKPQQISVRVTRREERSHKIGDHGYRTLRKIPQLAYSFPSFINLNATSIRNKEDELVVLMKNNSVDIACISEVWQVSEESINIPNYDVYLQTRKHKRGGGVGIFIREDIQSRRLLPPQTVQLETVWVWCRPRRLPREVSCIIVGCVYYPPRSPAHQDLIEHIVTFTDELRARYNGCRIVICGDFNDLNLEDIIDHTQLQQIVHFPTHQNNTLDLIFTDLNEYYKQPQRLAPLGRSQHLTVFWEPQATLPPTPHTRQVTTRPIKKSCAIAFGQHLISYPWLEVYHEVNVTNKLNNFLTSAQTLINHYFPTKQVLMNSNDQPWMTPYVKEILASRQRYFHDGNMVLFRYFRNKAIREINKSKQNYFNLKVSNIRTTKPSEWYKVIRNLTGGASKCKFNFLSDIESTQAANTINDHFSQICTSLPPLDQALLPEPDRSLPPLPYVEPYQVYEILCNLNVRKSVAPFDPPLRIIKQFAYEFAYPVANIINSSFELGIVPPQWKLGFITPLPKQTKPESCNDLRPVTITSIFARIAEKFVASWVRDDTQGNLDPHQYGNRKNTSTTHYLLYLTDFISKVTDAKGECAAVLSIDFSKAFDRVDNNIAMTHLLNNGMRPELVPWMSSFLTSRRQVVRYGGATSEEHIVTCGVPQGTVLGPLIFNNHINNAGTEEDIQCKFVDDITLACSYNNIIMPQCQDQGNRITQWAVQNNMKINGSKSKLMLIDFKKNKTIVDPITLGDDSVPIVNEMKLLGVIISNNLQWKANTKDIVSRASQRLFAVNKLKLFKANLQDLRTYYCSYIRPLLEYASTVWCSSLTHAEVVSIERIQKRFCKISLGLNYVDYKSALETLNLETLEHRRTIKFRRDSLMMYHSNQHRHILPPDNNNTYTNRLRARNIILEGKCNTERYRKSAVQQMTKYINNHFRK